MTCNSSFQTVVLIQISATRTVRRAATAWQATVTLLKHSWQDRFILIRMK